MTHAEIKSKVQKLLALSSSPNEHEAKAAMLRAQALLARYHMSMAEVTDGVGTAKEEPVVRAWCEVSGMRSWVRDLAEVVAKNFRCVVGFSSKGKHEPVFVGYESDAETAKQVISLAVKVADRIGGNIAQRYNDRGLSCKGVKDDYCAGFVEGLEQAYEEQVRESESCALMVQVPEAAAKEKASWTSQVMGFSEPMVSRRSQSYMVGYEDGHAFANRDQLPE